MPIIPAPSAATPVPNVVPFGNVKLEIIPTDSQTELQDVPSTRDDDASTKFHEPIETDFIITPETAALHDPKIVIEKRKRMQFLTIHKSLGHTIFHIMRLLCLAGILPRELTNVAPPICPGCSYGKSNRKPWHQKGKSNLKKSNLLLSLDKLLVSTSLSATLLDLFQQITRLVLEQNIYKCACIISVPRLYEKISIEHVSTTEMLADIPTKPLPTPQFKKLRDLIMGWTTS